MRSDKQRRAMFAHMREAGVLGAAGAVGLGVVRHPLGRALTRYGMMSGNIYLAARVGGKVQDVLTRGASTARLGRGARLIRRGRGLFGKVTQVAPGAFTYGSKRSIIGTATEATVVKAAGKFKRMI